MRGNLRDHDSYLVDSASSHMYVNLSSLALSNANVYLGLSQRLSHVSPPNTPFIGFLILTYPEGKVQSIKLYMIETAN